MESLNEQQIDWAVKLVLKELYAAMEKHGRGFNSAHEGYAVILEELDELWDEIKGHHPDRMANMVKEAAQVGAMAIRFLVDLNVRVINIGFNCPYCHEHFHNYSSADWHARFNCSANPDVVKEKENSKQCGQEKPTAISTDSKPLPGTMG